MALSPDMHALNADILRAHETGDGTALAALYGKAADALEEAGNEDAACFFYTQAYVFALETGHDGIGRYASILRSRARL